MKNINVLLSLCLLLKFQGSMCFEDVERLEYTLLQDGRISAEPPASITVSVGVALLRILDVDELNGLVTASVWERYLWTDERLKWDPEEFGGITALRVHPRDVYIPDITLYTSAGVAQERSEQYKVVIHNSGEVLYIPPNVIQLPCNIQEDGETLGCLMKYGSWAFDGFQIDVDEYEGVKRVDLADYSRHPYYQLAPGNWSGGVEVKYYSCCIEPYPAVNFPFYLKKRSNKQGEEDSLIKEITASMNA